MKGIPVGLRPPFIPFISLKIDVKKIKNIDYFLVTFLYEATGSGLMNVVNPIVIP